ncbi:MAG TPA: anti-sigma factor [bacterium]|nr:anti-sigma factor [bacterium]
MGKKTCQETIELLMDYLEKRLSPEEHAALKEHFDECPPCLDFVRSYRETPRIVREATAVQIPPEVEQRLKDFLRKNR